MKNVQFSELLNGAMDQEIGDMAMVKFQAEKKVIARELGEQIMLKINNHLHFKERSMSDFAREPLSEVSLFEKQLNHYTETDFEKGIPEMEAAEQDFSKEEFSKLKADIKERREIKERLLK
jgi:hypothetical protein